MKTMKFIVKCIGIVIAAALAGTAWLTLVFMLPVNRDNAQKSYEIIEQEGFYPNALKCEENYDMVSNFHSFEPAILDNCTDRIMLQTAMNENIINPLTSAMEMYSDAMQGPYARYWHGYVGILRPLLYLLDYGEIRILNGILQVLLLVVIAGMIVRNKKHWVGYVLMLASSYFLLMPVAMYKGLQFSWIFYVAVISGIVLSWKTQFFEQKKRFLYVFLLAGIMSSFLDLLTYPLFTWAFPLVWFMVLSKEDIPWLKRVEQVILSGLCWILGYGGMWACKWLIAGSVLRMDVLNNGMEKITQYTGGEGGTALSQRINALYLNWRHYDYTPFIVLLILWLVCFAIFSLRFGFVKNHKIPALLIVLSSAFVWYFVVTGHTAGHHFFTYRIYNCSVLAFMAIVLEYIYSERKALSVRHSLGMAGGWMGIAILSLGLACTARENVSAHNGTLSFINKSVEEECIFSMDFVPTFSEIETFGFGLGNPEAIAGKCIVSVYRDSEKLYEESVDLAEFTENEYYSFKTNWKLKHGEQYRLEYNVQPENNGPATGIYIRVTENGEMPLIEYSDMKIGESAVNGQILTGILYSCRPTDKFRLIALILTWMGVCGAVMMTGGVIIKLHHQPTCLHLVEENP